MQNLRRSGTLSAHCDSDMKQYVQIDQCRRRWLMDQFGCNRAISNLNQHDCCDICADQCNCGDDNCGEFWSPCEIRVSLPEQSMSNNQDSHDTTVVRTVTAQDKQNVRKNLLEFMQEMRGQVQVNKMVTCPNVLLEFNTFHINQVIESCQNLFTVENVLRSVEIWRHHHAGQVLKVISEVFGDVDIGSLSFEDDSLEDTIASDWGQIRDDSALFRMLDTTLRELISQWTPPMTLEALSVM